MTGRACFALLETTFVGVLPRASAGWAAAACCLDSGLVAWGRGPCGPRRTSFTTGISLRSAHGNGPLTGTATPMRHAHVGLDFACLAGWRDLAEAARGARFALGILRRGPLSLRPLPRGTQFVCLAHLALPLGRRARFWRNLAPRPVVAIHAHSVLC